MMSRVDVISLINGNISKLITTRRKGPTRGKEVAT